MAVIPPDDFAMSLPCLQDFGKGDLIKAKALATTLICDLSGLEWAARAFEGDDPEYRGYPPGDRFSFLESLTWFASRRAFPYWELRDFMHTVSPELIAGRKRPVRHKGLRAICWALLPFEVLSQLEFLLELSGRIAHYFNEKDDDNRSRVQRSVGAFIQRERPDAFNFSAKWRRPASNGDVRSDFLNEYVDHLLAAPEIDATPFDGSFEFKEQTEEPIRLHKESPKETEIETLDFESVIRNIFQWLTDLDLERLLFNVTAEFAAAACTRMLAGIPLSQSSSSFPKRRISRDEANIKARDYLFSNAARERQAQPVKGQKDEELSRAIADQEADFEASPLDEVRQKVRERKRL